MKIIAAVICLASFLSSVRAATVDDQQRAALVESAMRAMAARDFAWALNELKMAQSIAPSPEVDLLMASACDHLERVEDAIRYYKQYLAERPDAAERAEIDARLARLEPAQPETPSKQQAMNTQLKFLKWVLITFGTIAVVGIVATVILIETTPGPKKMMPAMRPMAQRVTPTQPLYGLNLKWKF